MATDPNAPQGATSGVRASDVPSVRAFVWIGILVIYALLFSVTGYIAFFQEPYNPAANPSDRVLKLMEQEPFREHLVESLKQESAAFKARKDLAAQSFNVVLGSLLGFLSASAVQVSRRSEST